MGSTDLGRMANSGTHAFNGQVEQNPAGLPSSQSSPSGVDGLAAESEFASPNLQVDRDGERTLAKLLRRRADATRTWSAIALAAVLILVLSGVGAIVLLPEFQKYHQFSSVLAKADELANHRIRRASVEYKLETARAELLKLVQHTAVVKLAETAIKSDDLRKKVETAEARFVVPCLERITKLLGERHTNVAVSRAGDSLRLTAGSLRDRQIPAVCRGGMDYIPARLLEESESEPNDADSAAIEIAMASLVALDEEFRRDPAHFVDAQAEEAKVYAADRQALITAKDELEKLGSLAKTAAPLEIGIAEQVVGDLSAESTVLRLWAETVIARQKDYVQKVAEIEGLEQERTVLKEVEEKLNTAVMQMRAQGAPDQRSGYDALASRVTAALLLVFLVKILVAVQRYSHRLSAFYDSRAD